LASATTRAAWGLASPVVSTAARLNVAAVTEVTTAFLLFATAEALTKESAPGAKVSRLTNAPSKRIRMAHINPKDQIDYELVTVAARSDSVSVQVIDAVVPWIVLTGNMPLIVTSEPAGRLRPNLRCSVTPARMFAFAGVKGITGNASGVVL
jgi:hypothetical protein